MHQVLYGFENTQCAVHSILCSSYVLFNFATDHIDIIVGRHSKKNHNNCAFCDKSTKFCICFKKCIISRFGYWAIKYFTSGGLGNHF